MLCQLGFTVAQTSFFSAISEVDRSHLDSGDFCGECVLRIGKCKGALKYLSPAAIFGVLVAAVGVGHTDTLSC